MQKMYILTKVKTGALNYNPWTINSFSMMNIEMYLKLDLVRFQPVLCNEVKSREPLIGFNPTTDR